MILISNGFSKFHLSVAASEMARRGLLSAFCTGAYPYELIRQVTELLASGKSAKLARLLARKEDIEEKLVFSEWLSETLYFLGCWGRQQAKFQVISEWMNLFSFRLYGYRAKNIVRKSAKKGAKLYHYRAGFGHDSVKLAKSYGMFTLCDHSIAYPSVLEQLVSNDGKWPEIRKEGQSSRNRFWRDIENDIKQADAVLVNSEFVKETFLWNGWEKDRVHVIYLGVDDAFLEGTTPRLRENTTHDSIRVAFAGSLEIRKGVRVLSDAMELLRETTDSFELHIAGGCMPDASDEIRTLLGNPRVRYHGLLPRGKLGELLASADIFVFPSLAEGSARVVFEALAAGCYVITTANSGSIVQDGIHGRLIPPGDPISLASALREAISLGRETINKIGLANSQLVQGQYRQSQYGEDLVSLYYHLLGGKFGYVSQRGRSQISS